MPDYNGTPENDDLHGTPDPDVINAGEGDDNIHGHGGNDELYGEGGNDFIAGGEGDDLIDGGDGRDIANYAEALDPVAVDLAAGTSSGADGNDTLVNMEDILGSQYDDLLVGDDNSNMIIGNAGNDDIYGAGGDDNLVGEAGDDFIYGDSGDDQLLGGPGDDYMIGGDGGDTANFYSAASGVTVDLVAGTATGEGEDTLFNIERVLGSQNADLIFGNDEDNLLNGSGGDDEIHAGGGNDNVIGEGGNDQLYGEDGSEHLLGGLGDDYLDGGDGDDTANYYDASGGVSVDLDAGTATGADGNDSLVNIENILGSLNYGDVLSGDDNDNRIEGLGGNDILRGFGGNDTVDGGDGADFLNGGFGDDYIYGGEGRDRAAYYTANAAFGGVTVSLLLQGQFQNTGAQGNDFLTGIENVSGTPFADTLIGDGNGNHLWGSAATISLGNVSVTNNDTLDGGGGNDLLTVGIGNHMLIGGSGGDTVRFTENGAGDPNITVTLQTQGVAQNAGAGSWTLIGIENLSGGQGNDTLTGDGNINLLAGDLGSDVLSGGGSNDLLLGDGYVNVDANGFITHTLDSGAVGGDDVLSGDDGDDALYGGAGNDTLRGGVGADDLNGGTGADLLIGGTGDDLVHGGDGRDRAGYYNINGTLTGVTVSLLLQGQYQNTGSQGWDLLTGIENLSGTPYADTLTGDSGDNWLWGSPATIGPGDVSTNNNDYLDGGNGNDLLTVGIGNHTLIGGNGIDTVRFTENGSPETGVTISLNLQDAPQTTGNGNWTLAGIENLSGGIANDSLTGNGQANTLAGDLGSDSLNGGGGADLLLGDGYINIDANGVITTFLDSGAAGANDSLSGGGGNDSLYGGAGNDFLSGGTGNDLIDGGAGIDRASFFHSDAAAGGISVNLNIAGPQNTGFNGVDTLVGIEQVSGTPFNDTLIGDDNDNWLWGSGAILNGSTSPTNNDTIDGGGGNDLITVSTGNHLLNGGSGTDTLMFNEPNSITLGINVSLALQGSAQDTGQGSWTLSGFENLSGAVADDVLTGDDNANILGGSLGNDTLSGGGGSDSLYGDGEFGIDNQGIGTGPIAFFADATTRYVGGFGGNDTLDGGLGDDFLYGGAGSDTASYASAGGSVQVYLYEAGFGEAFGANGYDQLNGIENLMGSGFADVLHGDEQNNVIDGGGGQDELRGWDGNDTLLGGAGDDIMVGGFGDDVIDGGDGFDRAGYFAQATSGVTVDLSIAGPQNTGMGWDTLVNIENVSGTPFADVLTGDDNDNWLWGSTGGFGSGANNDTLSGGGGNDLLTVGYGAHSLSGGSGTDTARYTENGGTEVNLSLSLAAQGAPQATGAGSWTLTGIENLSGGRLNDTLTGDGNANVLAGDSGNDTLVGGGGNDTLYGDGRIATLTGSSGPIATHSDVSALGEATGNDLLEGGLGNDTIDGGGGNDTATYANASGGVNVNLESGVVFGADGNDTLSNIENVIGSQSNDTLVGSTGANVLEGLGGNDFIQGNAGDDTLYGGDGDDQLNGDLIEADTSVSGNDTIYGGNGNDAMRGGLGDDTLFGGNGNDIMRGAAGVDSYDGGADDGEGANGIGDRVSFYDPRATQGVVADLRTGIISNDGYGNVEIMVGVESLGADTAFVDTFYGNDGRNYLAAGVGDFVYGFGGDDLFTFSSAAAVIDGGAGIDRLTVNHFGGTHLPDSNGDGVAEVAPDATAGWTVNLAAGTTIDGYGNGGTVIGIENVDGSIFGDTITGDSGVNVLNGFDGDDVLEGGLGNDTLNGGNGIDTASYANAAGAVTANLFTGSSGADGNDTYVSIENVIGSAFDDLLVGNTVANVLEGRGGMDTILGFQGNDTLYGGDGDDDVYGMQGNDTLDGGAGNDLLIGGTGNDVVDGGSGFNIASHFQVQNDTVSTGVTVDLRLQGTAQNTGQGSDTLVNIQGLSGTPFNDVLIGDDNVNVLISAGLGTNAPGGDDQLYGNGGDDLLALGTGNVLADGGSGNDTVGFGGAGATITHGLTISLALQGVAQATSFGNITLVGIENLSGSGEDDVLIGDDNANVLTGAGESDILVGGGGNDSLYGDGVYTFAIDDTHFGAPALVVDATTLSGHDAGNDTLEGGLGNDYLDGGVGVDTASYANASGAVIVDLGLGTSSGADGNDTLVNIENAIGSGSNDVLLGSDGANRLDGGEGHDVLRGFGGNDVLHAGGGDDYLDGGSGDDTIDGGAGYDRVSYFSATGPVTVDLRLQGQAQNTGYGLDTLIGIEHFGGTVFGDTLTGDGNGNYIRGSSNGGVGGADTIDGQGGDDLIEDGAGDHVLQGGAGTDTFTFVGLVGGPGINVSLAAQGAAQNTGVGMMTLTGFENLSGSGTADTLTGDGNANVLAGENGNDILSGGAGSDQLYGDGYFATDTHGTLLSGPIALFTDLGAVGGNDILEGGLGDDLLNGGAGSDTASYANASGAVTVDLGLATATGADGNDTLVSIENATGSAFNDRLIGDNGANTLTGGNGADYITGSNGNDIIIGGAGNDRAGYYQTNAALGGATVSLLITGQQNTGSQGLDTLSGIENVSGTPFADTLTGDGGDNWLWGAAATIAPGNVSTTNNDTLNGGGGNDLLTVGIGNHVLIGGTGTDTVRFTENGVPVEAALTVTLMTVGRAQNTGNGSWNLTGIENLSGGIGADKLTGDDTNNVIAGDLGDDNLIGNAGVDVLIGDGYINVDANGVITTYYDGASSGGNDTLNGGRGDDFLFGGRGNDTMVGGAGIDRFVIQANSGSDRIIDFAIGVDKVVFDTGSGPTSYGQLTLTKSGSNVLVTWSNGNSLLIEGVKVTDLTASHFEFGSPALPATAAASMEGPSAKMSLTGGFDQLAATNDFDSMMALRPADGLFL